MTAQAATVPAFVVGIGSAGHGAAGHVHHAIAALRAHAHIAVAGTSTLWPNPPAGGATQLGFVNAAAVVRSALAPVALLAALHAIEQRLGRVRAIRNGARTVDLDLLYGAAMVLPLMSPQLPHPRMHERAFVVLPALEALAAAQMPAPAWLVEAGQRLRLALPRVRDAEGAERA